MTRLSPVLLALVLAGCAVPAVQDGATPPGGTASPPAVIPPQLAPFLPPGTSPSVILRDTSGCYLYSIEVTDPPSGFPLRDGAGRQICEGQPVTLPPPPAPPATAAARAPVLPAPVSTPQPAPSGVIIGGAVSATGTTATGGETGGNLIDGIPITDIPAPAPLPVPLPTPVE